MRWTEDERIAEHLANLSALPDDVPGIIDVRVGKNFTERAKGCTHGLIVTLHDPAGLKVYQDHPRHVAVADRQQHNHAAQQ